MKLQDIAGADKLFGTLKLLDYNVTEQQESAIDESERIRIQKQLHQNYLSRKRTTNNANTDLVPVLLAPFLYGKMSALNFPILFDPQTNEIEWLPDVLLEVFSATFDEHEADELWDRLTNIAEYVRDNSSESFERVIEDALVDVITLFPHADENKVFESQCKRFRDALLKGKRVLIGSSALTVFKLLNLQLQATGQRHAAFLSKLKKRISALEDLLILQERRANGKDSPAHYGFASDLVSIQKVDQVAASKPSSLIPEARLNRIEECLNTLRRAKANYEEHSCLLFTTAELAAECDLEQVLFASRVRICEEGTMTTARRYVEEEMNQFVKVMSALKLSELELEQHYNEDLHAPYFDGFDITYLNASDLQFFRPVIIIEESREIASNEGEFIPLITGNVPAKVLAINRLNEAESDIRSNAESRELAALAIFRRNAYVFQGASDTPGLLYNALGKGLHAPAPALWNILLPPPTRRDDPESVTLIRAAIESRDFPRIEFDLTSGLRFGSHIKTDINPFANRDFPEYAVRKDDAGEIEMVPFTFTTADFIASLPEKRADLDVLSGNCNIEGMMPVAEYLVQSPDLLTGQVPYIWVSNKGGELLKAVVPISWLSYCRGRLEYWQFLQELGGTNSYHTQRALEDLQREMEETNAAEKERLETRLVAEFETSRKEELGRAISNMLYGLLDPEAMRDAPPEIKEIAATLSPEVLVVSEEAETGAAQNGRSVESKPEVKVSAEVWVESDLCTSCSDCIDALPSVFKYNADKQAYVHNPKGGSFAKIVATAEKCPARCIHPGLPHNPDEADLEKFIKRAEKFN